MGATALDAVTTGDQNVAMGHDALTANTTGWGNTAVGYDSLTTNIVGRNNTAVGYNASKTSNEHANSAFGAYALEDSTSGVGNTAIGYEALKENTTGGNNVAVGSATLDANTTGSNNTAIGASADVASAALTNATAIGYGASVAASNTMQLGNTDVTNVKTSGSITAGAITIPNTDGSANQVLKTDGSGTLSWTTPTDAAAIRTTIQTATNATSGSSSTASCPVNTTVLGGGCSTSADGAAYIHESYNDSNTWVCSYARIGGWQGGNTVTASAICL